MTSDIHALYEQAAGDWQRSEPLLLSDFTASQRLLAHVLVALRPGGFFLFTVPHPALPYLRGQDPPFFFDPAGYLYLGSEDQIFEGRILRRDGVVNPVRARHKTIHDYFQLLAASGWQRLPQVDELGITQAHLALDPAFFGPLQGVPLHLLFPLWRELRHGRGVALVRGPGDLPEQRLRRLFLALGRAIGQPDTTYGELYDVIDSGASHLERAIPISQTRAATSMHTDCSQRATHPRWVGLACVRQAAEGGGSLLASAVAVHDHLAEQDPEILRRHYRCFHRDLVTPGGARQRQQRLANRLPIYRLSEDGPSLRYMRHWIKTGHARLGKPLRTEDL